MAQVAAPSPVAETDIAGSQMGRFPALPVAGGGGMAPLSWSELVVSWLFYTTLLAVALVVAGSIVVILFGLNRRNDARAIDALEARVAQLELRLAAAASREPGDADGASTR